MLQFTLCDRRDRSKPMTQSRSETGTLSVNKTLKFSLATPMFVAQCNQPLNAFNYFAIFIIGATLTWIIGIQVITRVL